MSDLPNGWENVRISDVGELIYGKGLPTSQLKSAGYPVFGANGVIGFYDQFMYEDEQLLISCRGANSGTINVSPAQCFVTNNSLVLELSAELKSSLHFLKYALVASDKSRMVTGSAQPQVTIANAKGFALPFPPLPEQRRIVAKIDSLFGKSKRARDHLDHVPGLVEKYKQSVLSAAFKGDLTRKWRGERALEWLGQKPLNELCASITDGDHQAPPTAINGIPFITISAMNNGTIKLEKATRFVLETYLNSLKGTRRASRGDVLYSVTGSFGISALVDFDDPFVFQRHIAILKSDPRRLDAIFLFRILSSSEVMEQAESVATGTAQRTVPLSGLRIFSIPAPSLSEQREIVRRIEPVFTWIDRLASEAASARRLIDRLGHAVLTKAFQGELVPQDPTDEPASALLERIRIDKTRSGVTKRRSRVG